MKRQLCAVFLILSIGSLTCAPSRLGEYRADLEPAAPVSPAGSVIFFIGDGMGPQILSIAKIYSERSLGAELNMVNLANTGTAGYQTTHSADRPVTDSAASGTALATGEKTNNGVVGMSPGGREFQNLLERAVGHGKAVGVVTTTAVTHATPACFLAHVPSRDMQYEIAVQIVEGDAAVVLGGGYRYFLPPERGKRADGRDLTAEAKRRGFDVAFDSEDLKRSNGERLLGLFASDHLPYERARREDEVPSLVDMTGKALGILATDPDGFLLVVEGGRIDHAEHGKNISDAIGDFFAFDAAIGFAMDYQKQDSMLTIVVSADHDCGGPALTASESGYPSYDDLETLAGEDCKLVRWVSGDHTGTMVPVFARGPGAGGFSGVRENTDLFDGLLTALGL
ncbi:MAG: alkaline phosphatase [Candidatus Eisenbacteria bacterium]